MSYTTDLIRVHLAHAEEVLKSSIEKHHERLSEASGNDELLKKEHLSWVGIYAHLSDRVWELRHRLKDAEYEDGEGEVHTVAQLREELVDKQGKLEHEKEAHQVLMEQYKGDKMKLEREQKRFVDVQGGLADEIFGLEEKLKKLTE